MTKKDELTMEEQYKIIKEICENNKLEFKKYLGAKISLKFCLKKPI